MLDLKKVGKNIASIRKRNGYTQISLANTLNVSTQAVSKWENGKNLPEVSLLVTMAGLFQISVDDILMGEVPEGDNHLLTAQNGILRLPIHYGDDTCSSCVVAGDYIFLAHHGGGQDVDDIVHQTRASLESMAQTLASVGAVLDDLVQLNYYIRDISDFRRGADTFREYFKNGSPARTTVVTEFVGKNCLCQIDGIAYKPVKR
ncbi:MAG: helix-turn-helix domain-containing protein [Clostridia bacterium]|nr:helix-turn-helix domain-containing protein [Clostridia bacterium]MBQ4574938.1 helix-turn-helix domain-containing protein [Clostridia bacterium]